MQNNNSFFSQNGLGLSQDYPCQVSNKWNELPKLLQQKLAVIPGNIFCQNTAWNDSRLLNTQCDTNWKSTSSHLFAILLYAAVLYMCDTLYAILHKSENATLQYFIFCEKVLDEKYLLKINNVLQTSSKRFVETPPIFLFWCLSYVPYCV